MFLCWKPDLEVAEIPKICQRYVVPSSESHFSVDMNEVMDTGKSSFAINSASGTKLLEVPFFFLSEVSGCLTLTLILCDIHNMHLFFSIHSRLY